MFKKLKFGDGRRTWLGSPFTCPELEPSDDAVTC